MAEEEEEEKEEGGGVLPFVFTPAAILHLIYPRSPDLQHLGTIAPSLNNPITADSPQVGTASSVLPSMETILLYPQQGVPAHGMR